MEFRHWSSGDSIHISRASSRAPNWAGEKLVLHKLRFHADFVAPFSPPCEGGAGGVVSARPVTRSSHALSLSVLSHPSRQARRIVFAFQGSRITPPAPPSQGGERARSRRHSIARHKNTRLEIVPPAQSTPTFHRPSTELRDPVSFGERSPRLDAVGVSVILTPPAPLVANAKPLERSKSLWIGGEKHSHGAPGKGLTGRPDMRLKEIPWQVRILCPNCGRVARS